MMSREYKLITEAQAQLSVVGKCSRSSLPVCLGGGETAGGGGGKASSSRGFGGGGGETVQRERESEQFRTKKVNRGLLLLIHFL
jgi:hypothetical protein